VFTCSSIILCITVFLLLATCPFSATALDFSGRYFRSKLFRSVVLSSFCVYYNNHREAITLFVPLIHKSLCLFVCLFEHTSITRLMQNMIHYHTLYWLWSDREAVLLVSKRHESWKRRA